MALKNSVSLGGPYIEVTCTKCGRKFTITPQQSVGAKEDEKGDMWPYCWDCYEGPVDCDQLCKESEQKFGSQN